MQYGCIGEHLKHSFSAEIHHQLADYQYEIKEIPPEKLTQFLNEKDFYGINVTIPYKEKVIPFLSEITPEAESIGAVNTIVNRDGRLCGYNTDFYGMCLLSKKAGISIKNKKVAILGSGGTARTAEAVARSLGAREVLRIGRKKGIGILTYDELYNHHRDTEILINTTPCGMFPYPDGNEERAGCPVDISYFSSLSGVLDAVFNPLRTNLILDAMERGIPAAGGLYMLVAQAVKASEIFSGKIYPEDTCDKVFEKIFKNKENIVLCGMPSCGKTTIGRLIAQKLSLPFLDTDELIAKESRTDVCRIIEEQGEAAFRVLETKVVAEAGQRTGVVLSTGGGTVLKDENVRALRRNGKIIFLDRPPELLMATPDRPLSSDRALLKRRYEERYGRYTSICDLKINGADTPEAIANTIIRELGY